MTHFLTRRGFIATSVAAASATALHPQLGLAQGTKVLRYGLSAFPPSFEMWASTGAAAGAIKLMIHRGLVSYDPEGKLRGELAESWEVDDDGKWTFKLRDATWHDGTPVTAADVKWTIEQTGADNSTAYRKAQMAAITHIDTPDEKTVILTTAEPAATLPGWFGHYAMPILKEGSETTSTNGAGPFKFVSQERGVKIIMEANPDYYKEGEPALDRIEAIVYSDENLRVAALEAGDVDLIEYVPWPAMDRLEADAGIKLDLVPGPFMYMVFNGTKAPFNNPLVRRAIGHAIKKDDVVAAAFYGHGAPLDHMPFDPSSPFYNEDLVDGWAYDPEKAKALLAEAGYPDGFSCTMLSTAQYGMHQSTAEVAQAYLSMIGVNVTLDLPDWSTRVQKGNAGEYDIAVMGTTADSNDPDGYTNVIDGALAPAYVRSFGIETPKITEALHKGRQSFDQAERKAIYHEMEKVCIEESPVVFLCSRAQGFAMKTSVTGYSNLPGQLTFYSGITLEETDIG
ncbi:peptide ABC transporter substrate-binding protein [Thioclava sp. SK-1]|uniref:ABC transporter substrate-binding protein n=1 Tax=Thioclava sp. SK-1 TaxID=1889770 RepID=UPI0008270DF0|nr:ABC transporter substrate-binding protein [Thioclava sp. SK-1]OCX58177.1 peptide ABC transporter substrate-binding protein [Thioclava sp. SK-1]